MTYDDLYRLTSASTTQTYQNPYLRTYTYDSIGNILTKSDQGSYSYSETGYTNPHAVTAIGGVNYVYDNNGNVISGGAWDYLWNYRDRLIQSTDGNSTSTYQYDQNNTRTTLTVDGATTTYANKYYDVKGATSTAHIFAPDGTVLAVVKSSGVSTSTYYTHSDHLGSTDVVTDEMGDVVQTLDYYPFGTKRIDSGVDVSQREFGGHEFDGDSDLTYMKARYYDQDIGKFLSIDPAARSNPRLFVSDPQQLNLYSYARNNPIVLIDPLGLWVSGGDGSFTAESGDTLSGLQQETGRAWQDTGFTRDPTTLQIGETVSFNPQTSNIGDITVDSTWEASSIYFWGSGGNVNLGPNTTNALEKHPTQIYHQERITSGQTTANEGNYGVNLTGDMFHVGNTRVNYYTTTGTKYGVTTFTGFSGDGYWDVRGGDDGPGPKGETLGGTPYSYNSHSWTISYPKP